MATRVMTILVAFVAGVAVVAAFFLPVRSAHGQAGQPRRVLVYGDSLTWSRPPSSNGPSRPSCPGGT